MGYYKQIYTLGSATEMLKKPEKKRTRSASPVDIEKIRQEIKESRLKAKERGKELKEDTGQIETNIEAEQRSSKGAAKKTKKPFILIAVPCYRTILVRTAWSIMDTLRQYSETDIAFHNGVFVHQNQNELVKIAKEKKASHIFFVEHDVVFEPDTLGRLLEQDKDVIAAPYSGRKLPKEPLVYQKSPTGELYMMTYDIWPDKPTKVYGVPTGCTLIKMSVFDKISKPYFFFEYNKKGKMLMSQDIYFSKKVNEAGMECWIDPTIPVTHVGDFDY